MNGVMINSGSRLITTPTSSASRMPGNCASPASINFAALSFNTTRVCATNRQARECEGVWGVAMENRNGRL